MATGLADPVFLHGEEYFLATELADPLDESERLADHVVGAAFVARLVEHLLVVGVAALLLLCDSLVLEVMLQLVTAHDKEWSFKVSIVRFYLLLWLR